MENIVIFVLIFVSGVVLGIYIMTQIENKNESDRMDQLLELEDHINSLKKYNKALLDKLKPKTMED
tara:strand:+ start:27052 stop:27249 length:198 start_codon:yes stop_codon:yes gene_type:complete